MLVLVVGASGVLGRETVRNLLRAGHGVRGMTRNPKRLRELEAIGTEPVVGDLIDTASLTRACADVDRVFAAAHGFLGRGRYRSEAVDDAGHRALIDAARNAGVSGFVYTSALGAAPDHPVDFFRTKSAIERYLAASGLDHVVLRPSAFIEWHAHEFNGKGILERGRTVILGSGVKPRNFVAARDVAAIAAERIAGPMRPARILELLGPGNFTNDEVARLYARMADGPARIVHVPRSALSAIGALVRPFHSGLAQLMRVASLPDDAFAEISGAPTPGCERVIGPTSLEDFIRERIAERSPALRSA